MYVDRKPVMVKGPNDPSVDAVFPYAAPSNAQILHKHCAESIEVTSTALNFVKYIDLPTWLREIQFYVSKHDELDAGTIREWHFESFCRWRLVKRAEECWKLALEARFQRKLRETQPSNRRSVKQDIEEYIKGRIRDTPGPWEKKTYAPVLDGLDWPRPTAIG